MNQPWRVNTTVEISSQDDSRYETPGGAQNKVDTAFNNFKNEVELPIRNESIVERHYRSESVSSRALAQKSVQRIHLETGVIGWAELDPSLLEDIDDVIINANFESINDQLLDLSVNVKFPPYNAVGNWNGTTGNDDSSAINEALSGGNKTVLIPPGTYYITQPLLFESNTRIIGNNATIIGDVTLIRDKRTTNTADYVQNVHIEGITFKKINHSFSETDYMFELGSCENIVINDNKFIGFNGDAIIIDTTYQSYSPLVFNDKFPTNVKITNNLFDGQNYLSRNPISMAFCENIRIENNTFKNCGSSGMPGSICIEPWNIITDRRMVKDIIVNDNVFENMHGSGGCVHYFLGADSDNLQFGTQNISVTNNQMSNIRGSFFYFYELTEDTKKPNGVIVKNNNFHSASDSLYLIGVIAGMNNMIVSDNTFNNPRGTISIGKNGIEQFKTNKNLLFKNNTLYNPVPVNNDGGNTFIRLGENENTVIGDNIIIISSDVEYNQLFIQATPPVPTNIENVFITNNIVQNTNKLRYWAFVYYPNAATGLTITGNSVGTMAIFGA